MVQINPRRMTVEMEGGFAVFLIGMRINRFWKVWRWLPVALAMPRMLGELSRHPELGLLHFRTHFGLRNVMVVQYWRSFDHLHAYATGRTFEHLPAWQRFNRLRLGEGDVGIWHETYLVPAGQYECIYQGMPAYGLGRAGTLVEAAGLRRTARQRLGLSDENTPQYESGD